MVAKQKNREWYSKGHQVESPVLYEMKTYPNRIMLLYLESQICHFILGFLYMYVKGYMALPTVFCLDLYIFFSGVSTLTCLGIEIIQNS